VLARWAAARGCARHGRAYGTPLERALQAALLAAGYELVRDKLLESGAICAFWLPAHATAIYVDGDADLADAPLEFGAARRVVRAHEAPGGADAPAVVRALAEHPARERARLWLGLGPAYDAAYARAWLGAPSDARAAGGALLCVYAEE
jgi:hypothetical protein